MKQFSVQRLGVLGLLISTHRPMYIQEIARSLCLNGGVVQPILVELERQGWARDNWEDDAPVERFTRHYFSITPAGVTAFNKMRQMKQCAFINALATILQDTPPEATEVPESIERIEHLFEHPPYTTIADECEIEL